MVPHNAPRPLPREILENGGKQLPELVPDLRRTKSDKSASEKDGPSEEIPKANYYTQNRGRSAINEAPKNKNPIPARDKSANSVD